MGAMTYQQSGINTFRLEDHRLILGKQLNRALAIEVHIGNSSTDTEIVGGLPTRLTIDNYIAGFFKANITFASKDWDYNRFRLYGMVGGTRIQSTTNDTVTVQSGVQTSVAAGIGMEFFLDNIAVQFGYTRYVNESTGSSSYNLDSMHIGVVYQFGRNVANAR